MQLLRIVEQAAEMMPSGDFRADDRKVTPSPRVRIDESMEALIHHFKIFTEGFRPPPGEAYAAVESPRGEPGCYLVSYGGGMPWRCHIRVPFFCNLQALPVMLAESMVADTIVSLDSVMGDVDRQHGLFRAKVERRPTQSGRLDAFRATCSGEGSRLRREQTGEF